MQLPSKSNDVKKYSIFSNDDVQFVHVFLEQSSKYASCMSGLCQCGFSKKRKLEYLREHQNLCIHAEVFLGIYDQKWRLYFFGFCSRSIKF